jgi:branched-chain amino acid aminotransferase
MTGITRSKVIQVCLKNQIPCRQKNFSLYDVYSADEAFVTGTFGGLTPVRRVDGKLIGNFDLVLTQRLQALYYEMITGS